MVVAVLTLSLRRAAWYALRIRDTLSVQSTLLIILYQHSESLRRLSSALSSVDNTQSSRGSNNQFPCLWKAPHLTQNSAIAMRQLCSSAVYTYNNTMT